MSAADSEGTRLLYLLIDPPLGSAQLARVIASDSLGILRFEILREQRAPVRALRRLRAPRPGAGPGRDPGPLRPLADRGGRGGVAQRGAGPPFQLPLVPGRPGAPGHGAYPAHRGRAHRPGSASPAGPGGAERGAAGATRIPDVAPLSGSGHPPGRGVAGRGAGPLVPAPHRAGPAPGRHPGPGGGPGHRARWRPRGPPAPGGQRPGAAPPGGEHGRAAGDGGGRPGSIRTTPGRRTPTPCSGPSPSGRSRASWGRRGCARRAARSPACPTPPSKRLRRSRTSPACGAARPG